MSSLIHRAFFARLTNR